MIILETQTQIKPNTNIIAVLIEYVNKRYVLSTPSEFLLQLRTKLNQEIWMHPNAAHNDFRHLPFPWEGPRPSTLLSWQTQRRVSHFP